MDRQEPSRRWPTRSHVLWTVGIVIVVVALLLLIRLGYAYRWTGFGQYKVNGEVQPYKTVWDLLELLGIPAVLAFGGLWFNHQQRARERYIENQRAQDEALQAYLDQMSQLLTDKDRPLHRAPQGDSLRTVARARTLTVVERFDGDRKGSVVRFLYESGLVRREPNTDMTTEPIVSLKKADLRGAVLSWTNFELVNLYRADLKGADLRGTILSQASFYRADLRKAVLRGTDLRNAILDRADLEEANLLGAKVNRAQLKEAKSLKGATMRNGQILKSDDNPNGPTFEEWLKSKGSGEDGETQGSS